jgi:hypothetical protein
VSRQGTAGTTWSRVYGAVRLVLVVAIVGYLCWQVYSGRSAWTSLQPQWDKLSLAGAFLSAIAAYQCLFVGWVILLRRTGHYSAGQVKSYLRIWWISYLYRYVPGKLLLAVERARMGSAVGIPPAAGAALTVVETLLSILAGSAVSLLAVTYYTEADAPVFVAAAGFAIVAVFVFPAGFRVLCGLQFVKTRYPELASVALGSGDILVSVLPYILHYLLLGLSFFLLSRNLELLTWVTFPGLFGIYALSHVVGLIALFAPGGLGVREGALAVQLGRLLPTGVAEALAIGVRIWFTLIELLCYFVVLLLSPSRPDRFK